MKRHLKVSIIIAMIITITLISGCASSNGIIISNAMRKNLETNSYESQSKLSFNFTPKNMNLDDEEELILDLINNLSLTHTTKNDFQNNKHYTESTLKSNGISITGLAYSNAQKAWLKFPHKSKYIEIDPTILAPEGKDRNSIQMNKDFRNITFDFLKGYIKQYNYSFKNIKNLGKTVVSTPEGDKEVTNIQIPLDKTDLRNLFEYTILNIIDSDLSKDYIKSIVTLINDSIDTSKIEGYNYEEILSEIDNAFEEGRKYAKENSKEFVDSVIDDLSYRYRILDAPYNNKNAVVLTYSIDKNGNIIKSSADFNFTLSNNYGDESIICSINYSSLFYNINNTKVEMPEFTDKNTIPFKKYVSSNYELKNSPIGEILGVDTRRISFTTGLKMARVNYSDLNLEVAPYIKGDTALVPGVFLAENLRLSPKWDESSKTLTLTDSDNNTFSIKEGSRSAYFNKRLILLPVAPEMSSGVLMVPVRVVAEQFDAYISGYPSYEYEGELSIYITK